MSGLEGNHNSPLVSVIIPAFNSAEFIVRAVESVLTQTYSRYEVIVVDDGSTDGTKSVLCQFGAGIRYVYRENHGPSAARNTGIGIATGRYICFLDADDFWMPKKLEVQVAFMAQHPDIGLVFTDEEEFDEEKILHRSILAKTLCRPDLCPQRAMQDVFAKLIVENFIPTSTVMVRRECFQKVGLFDETLRSVEDRDMWLRIAAHFQIACVSSILAKKQVHSSNISKDKELALRSRIRVWEKNRRLFSSLASATVYNRFLADTHLQLGYILLPKRDGKGARRAGLASLANAVLYVVTARSLFPYRWLLAILLIPLSFVRWPLVQSLWQTKDCLLNRERQQTD